MSEDDSASAKELALAYLGISEAHPSAEAAIDIIQAANGWATRPVNARYLAEQAKKLLGAPLPNLLEG